SSFGPEPNADPPPAVDNTRVILPADLRNAGGFAGKERENRGFYVLGPTLSAAEASPFAASGAMETLRRPEMSYVLPANLPPLLLKPSLLLQRLACPHLPPQPDPSLPLYNSYLTVDYMRDVPTNYAAAVGLNGPNAPAPTPAAERASWGR